MKFYSLERPRFRWGDYGDILLHGMAARDEASGLLLLKRTGNSVPPISFPGLPGVVVTEGIRSLLVESGLTGFSFQPLVKHRIVDLDWPTWDPDAVEPAFYPESGEPEDYLLGKNHDEVLSGKMPELWELVPGTTAHVQRIEDTSADYGVRLSLRYETWNGDDFFRAPEVLYDFVTQRTRDWLENEAKGFVDFKEW
jgi:hypothetical protein